MAATVRIGRAQALAFRLARQRLAAPAPSAAEAAASCAVQDSPPGSAALALHARLERFPPDGLERLLEDRAVVQTYNARLAACVLPVAEAPAFLAGLRPPDERALTALLATALPAGDLTAAEVADIAAGAVGDALDGRVLSRDELHEELRRRLPEALLPWCRGCQSHHARRPLLGIAALRGILVFAGRRGRQPAFARADQWLGAPLCDVDPTTAAAALVRRFLRHYGPATPAGFAGWAGLSGPHARWAWGLAAAETAEVAMDGVHRAWALADDVGTLRDAEPPVGVRLLPPGDPYLLARDRDVLVPDEAVRRRIWQVLSGPGVVLAGGEIVASWRPRKQGRRLTVAVEPFAPLAAAVRDAIAAEAQRAAPHRGAATADVRFADA